MHEKEKRNFHLSYCKFCDNRLMNFNKGLLCKLTNDKADFDNNGCAEYIEDKIEKEKQRRKIENLISEKYSEFGFINSFINKDEFKSYKSFYTENWNSKNKKIIIERDNTLYQIGSFLIIPIIVYSIYLHSDRYRSFDLGLWGITIFLLILNYYFVKVGFLKKLRSSEIEISEKYICFKTYNRVNNKLKLEKIYWKDIVDFGIKRKNEGRYIVETFVLFEISGNEIEINGNDFEMINDKIVSIVKSGFQKTFHNNV